MLEDLRACDEFQIQRLTACRLELIIESRPRIDNMVMMEHWEKRGFADMDIHALLSVLKDQKTYLEDKQSYHARFAVLAIKVIEKKLYG